MVDDDFTEYARTFIMSDFLSTLNKSFLGVSTILNNNKFFIRMSCQEEVFLFSNLLLPKLKIILIIDHGNEFCYLRNECVY